MQNVDEKLLTIVFLGLVNYGIIEDIPRPLIKTSIPLSDRESILVIGAGPAGISAARQLHNFGYHVTVLEARNRLGGRVHDISWVSPGSAATTPFARTASGKIFTGYSV